MKIYTKSGDEGETGLLGGIRVAKTHPAIVACGDIDETNCWIGVVLTDASVDDLTRKCLTTIQHHLFNAGAIVAASATTNSNRSVPPIGDSEIAMLEASIDQFDATLPPLEAFILPGGSPAGSHLHLARTVCRRAERSVVTWIGSPECLGDLAPMMIWLNRLSDLLFVLARCVNHTLKHPETQWQASSADE